MRSNRHTSMQSIKKKDDAVGVAVRREIEAESRDEAVLVAARRGLALDDDLPRDCRHIELSNQSDFIELRMDLKWTD